MLEKGFAASFFYFFIFYELQFQKLGCGCRSGSAHGFRPENSLGFVASGMVRTHQCEGSEVTGSPEGILF